MKTKHLIQTAIDPASNMSMIRVSSVDPPLEAEPSIGWSRYSEMLVEHFETTALMVLDTLVLIDTIYDVVNNRTEGPD